MKPIRLLAQYYVDLLVKLGLIRFSMLVALVLCVLAVAVQVAVTVVLRGQVDSIDMIRSIFFGLLITPWAVYFLSVVVEQLEESRQHLANLVDKLEEMRERDHLLNHQLEQKSMFLRSFIDASPDLVFYRNENRAYSGCNRAMELLTGKSEQQLIGLKVHEVHPQPVAQKIIEMDEKVFGHNVSITYEQWFDYPDGRKVCFEIREVPYYDRQGRRHGLMGFGRDITERKRYQEVMERASRDKTTFISTVSHELRTPLNGIVGLSHILMDTHLNQEQENYLKTIYVSAVTLGNIFSDIIDMDKFERRNLRLDNQPLDLIGFLADLENLSGLQAQQKGLRFVLEPVMPLPQNILTDGTRLRQILWNLISNAVKFTAQGQVTVRVCYQQANAQLRFEVKDSGMGIPPEECDKIFTLYYQVQHDKGGKPATGTGIGLAISRRLAKNMGGDITVTSTPGVGSCFCVSVRASCVEASDDITPDNNPLPALHILLVEDIELNVTVIRAVLEKLGSSVDVAMTGGEALEKFDPDEYDLVLLDIQLPDISGTDISRELKRRYAGTTLPPLVALTANVLRNKQDYLDAGMDDVLSKPLEVPALVRVIRKFWDGQVVSSVPGKPEQERSTDVLDIDMLTQYLEIAGTKVIHDGLDMFRKTMPGYLTLLKSNLMAHDQDGIVFEGHKIKGAAGSIGLCHLQQLGQQIQNRDLPAWWDNVTEWIDEIEHHWQQDAQALQSWLDQIKK